MINVADVVMDVDFVQPVTRIVRTETVNSYGESVLSSASSTIQAVVTNPSAQELLRFSDATAYRSAIRVTTGSRLNADSVGLQPDLILYHGEHYIVSVTNDYSDFGFTRAICNLIDMQDQPN